MTSGQKQILCIGSVLWDVVGRTSVHMKAGADVPGRITRLPGGVALNIAMTLARFGLAPTLLSAVGQDAEGHDLVAACAALGVGTDHLYRSEDLPTDRYMAVEAANGLIAAIADAHSLETAGARILQPLSDGRLGTEAEPYRGAIALDGNLTLTLLEDIAASPLFAAADLRIAPASPGKATRLRPFLAHGRGILYVNREEAGHLCGTQFDTSRSAALALLERGAERVLVTDGDRPCCDADAAGCEVQTPPEVMVTRITGAGDTFMAAHIAAELDGADRATALTRALDAAAAYVSGKTEL